MHSPAFFIHTKVSTMQKQSTVKVDYHEVNQYQSSSRPRATSLPALTQRFKSTLSRTHRHSPYSSSSSLRSTPTAPSPQTKSHSRSFSDSIPRINLRSLFVGRRRSAKPQRNIDDLETEEESETFSASRLLPPSQRKCHNMFTPDVSTFNDTIGLYLDIHDGNIIQSQYTVTGPIREEEPLALDIPLSVGQFDDDEDVSEPEEDDFLLMQEVVLERINFRL
ncbi:hypothetical protein CPB85DRAFT_1442769 [Mucidula mucida]|nr:hypothetical protein CPB85DRAFT_1442769 [Mucidula mucida]